MGSKLSCVHGAAASVSSLAQQPAQQAAPSRVVATDGSLKELPLAPLVAVRDVLGPGDAASSSFFVCNADALYFNQHPPPLAATERLMPGQIYFVLPAAMFGRPLSSAEMAALAVRAAAALAAQKPQRRRRDRVGRKKQVRVVPITREKGKDGSEECVFYEKLNELTVGKFAAFTSPPGGAEKAAEAVASRKTRSSAFRRMLSIIREGGDGAES